MVASDIISQILQRYKMLCAKYPQSPSFIPNTKGDSFYLISNRGEGLQPTQIRLSNHGTYLETWCDRNELGDSVERLNPALCVNISIVFVDEGEDLTKDCKGMPNCEGCEIEPCKPQTFEGQDQIGRPFTVIQYVYSSKCIRRKYINGLTKAIAEASTKGKYIDPLADLYRAAKEKEFHSSTKLQNNKGLKPENKQYKRNTNMNKKLIKLTESDLHRIVKESVNRILREASYDINSPEYKQMYDNGNRWPDEMDDTALTNREISDYEALPDRARHPYGQDFPNFSGRIANRAPVTPKDKLASKRPNSVLDMQNKKRALNGMDPATAEHIRRNRDKEENDMIKYGYAGY